MDVVQMFECDESPTETDVTSMLTEWEEEHGSKLTVLRLYLHPLFTRDITWLNSATSECPCSAEFLDQVGQAARSYIGDLVNLNRSGNQPVLCIWLMLERVLQAGFVWIIFVLRQIQTGRDLQLGGDWSNLLEPLSLCDSLLTLFCEKWKPGLPYHRAWNIVRQRVSHTVFETISQRVQ